jgi:hypothetical protein
LFSSSGAALSPPQEFHFTLAIVADIFPTV